MTKILNQSSPHRFLNQHGSCDYKAFWESPKRLREEIAPSASVAIPALLFKKGGDFPDFWKQALAFPHAMEKVYEAIRKN